MKEYQTLNICPSWRALIYNKGLKELSLFLKDDENYIACWDKEDDLLLNKVNNRWKKVDDFLKKHDKEYISGYLGYDIKNSIEKLDSNNKDTMGYPELVLTVHKNVLIVQKGQAFYFGSQPIKTVLGLISESEKSLNQSTSDSISLKPNTEKDQYIRMVNEIKSHIQRGDIYEMNYCVNFTAKTSNFSANRTFEKLYDKTEAPFSAFMSGTYGSLLSASPERFLRKKNEVLISQPIKGTAARSSDQKIDLENSRKLQSDEKEKAENVMIVDLVRNDFSKIAEKNSVEVTELFKLNSFKSVHQLISTIKCQISGKVSFSDVLKATFPMGSMTGAPKINAMRFAEKYESFKRNAYSGSIILFDPFGNFDASVVIRSIIYNANTKVISAPVGGAITIKSDAEKEYLECLVKLKASQEALC